MQCQDGIVLMFEKRQQEQELLSKAPFRLGNRHQSKRSLLLVPEHKFGHCAWAQALAPEVKYSGTVAQHGH